jgi:hypothetical protein
MAMTLSSTCATNIIPLQHHPRQAKSMRQPHQMHPGTVHMVQVPVRTSVWLLDKVFATVPELKAGCLEDGVQDRARGTLESYADRVDTRVSADFHQLAPRFAPWRTLQKRLNESRPRAVSLDTMQKAAAPRGGTAARQCAPEACRLRGR